MNRSRSRISSDLSRLAASPFPTSSLLLPTSRAKGRAFTLIELLVVMGIIVVMTTLLVPAFTSLKRSDDVTAAVFDVNGALEAGRTFAIANNTYVWIGFFEEDVANTPSTNPRPAGTGRIIMSIVAAKDGTRYKDTQVDPTTPHAFYAPPGPSPIAGNDSNPVILMQVGKLIKIENSHLSVLPSASPSRPSVATDYQIAAAEFGFHPPTVGTTPVANPTSFNYPVDAVSPNIIYTFTKIVEFSPRGEALKILDLPTQLLEIGLQPTHGNVADAITPNVASIQIAGSTGRTKIYR